MQSIDYDQSQTDHTLMVPRVITMKRIQRITHVKHHRGVWPGIRSMQCQAISNHHQFNSLPPGRCDSSSWNVIFKPISQIHILSTSHEIAYKWITPDLFNWRSTLVQVMAWCRQATNHYLSQCWLIYVAISITGPQWLIRVDIRLPYQNTCIQPELLMGQLFYGHFNTDMPSHKYRNSHNNDKTILSR